MKNPKPKPVKPVLAWCVVGADRMIRPGWCCAERAVARNWFDMRRDGLIIRVEIRPAPKRGKRTKP